MVVLVTLVALPAFAVIDLPRGTCPQFRWDPVSGPIYGYGVYGYCNGGERVITGFAGANTTIVYPDFCDTLVVRVAAWAYGPGGGEGPLSEPSEMIRFVDEEDAEGSGTGGATGDPGEAPPSAGSADSKAPLDFDGDAASDILVQNAETGELEIWGLEGDQAVTVSTLPTLADEARVVGNGDMNGDGSADLLYLNGETGELGVWLTAGGAVIGGGVIADLGDDWDVVGNGDHDGDGLADILLHRAATGELELWTMNGPQILEAGPLSRAQGARWEVAATGDYDGDGRADLLWHDPDAGQIDIWLMNERTLVTNRVVSSGLGSAWKIVAAGDFDLDGQGDFVWRSKTAGGMGIWFLEAGGLRAQSALDVTPRPIERVVGAGDYDGDGLLDLLVQRRGSRGRLRVLFMNGSEILDKAWIGELRPPWFVAGVGQRSPTP
jgi:hypothetical protein